jgi:hypothetical protein
MTGKDDWRIIHVGPAGVFTDSLVYAKPKQDSNAPQNFITEMQQTGGNQTTTPAGGVNVGTRQRPSDQLGAPGAINNPGQPGVQNPNGTGAPPSTEPVMVLPDGRIVPVSQGLAILNGQTPPGQQGQPNVQAPGQPFPNNNTPGNPQFPPGVQLPPGFQQAQNPQGGLPGQLNAPVSPINGPANAPPAAAANLINQLLTTPRPGGLNGAGGPPGTGIQPATVDQNGNPVPANNGFGGATTTTAGFVSTPAGSSNAGTSNMGTPAAALGAQNLGPSIGGGMAGVASKREQQGIKTYKDRTSYNEWEFVYDITKDPARVGAAAAIPAGPAPGVYGTGAPGAPAQQQPGSPGTGLTLTPIQPGTPVPPPPAPVQQ